MAFVDYKKAFDSIELQPLLNSLSSQGTNKTYINLIRHLYSNAKSVVRTETDSKCFRVKRGVRQGDTISPILFNIALNNEMINKTVIELLTLTMNIFTIFCMKTILFSSHIPPTNSKAC